jgi:hypothetical protein
MNVTQPDPRPPDWAMNGTEDHRHGSANGYGNLGCRCDRCRAAWTAYSASRRAAKQTEVA